MKTEEIRETFLDYFQERGHLLRPSASLVPSSRDESVLLTTAGMQPFKPYFMGEERPPRSRLTSCQRCFRTTDIDEVGKDARHLTFFEMLGNFSFGDYFKREAVHFAWELSNEGFGIDHDAIWVTVFGGDDDLGLGPDEEAVAAWLEVGLPRERIVHLGRKDNYWQAGGVGPSGPCSEMYVDRGVAFGGPDDRPGDETDRFLEFWNLVFMQYELKADGSIEPLPSKNIDTGLGVERMAAMLQDAPSVFETDGLRPIVELGEELCGRRYGQDPKTTKALRILTDHGRAMTFLLADGIVPSNEERGYVLRRVMRRAVQQGRAIGVEGPILARVAERVIESMADLNPHLHAEREAVMRWAAAEEEAYSRTVDQGSHVLGGLLAQAKRSGERVIPAEEVFRLHDTFGFPFELTRELAEEEGLEVDADAFERLMAKQRRRARAGAVDVDRVEVERERIAGFAARGDFQTRFVGYETTEVETTLAVLEAAGAGWLAKLPESPFYPEGGGQVSDVGYVESESNGARARVTGVERVGDDQVVALTSERGDLREGDRVRAVVERRPRHATMANHTGTHLLHAALRGVVGEHARQAGSYVGPDKLRFDFAHSGPVSGAELSAVEDQVNSWIAEALPVRAIFMSKEEATAAGATALFGEKYGDWVRVVDVEGVSIELCGGTHVANTSEIGVLKIVGESSSGANVRRIEAVTGPEAVRILRASDRDVREAARIVRREPDELVAGVEALRDEVESLRGELAAGAARKRGELATDLAERAERVEGIAVLCAQADGVGGADELLELTDRLKSRLAPAAVLLAADVGGRASLVANFDRRAVEKGLDAGRVIGAAAKAVGGGGGGRPTMARAGGRDPSKIGEALASAEAAMREALAAGRTAA